MKMKFDENTKDIISKYIESQYNDPLAHRHLNIFLSGFSLGWTEAIEQAGQYVNGWHSNMDYINEATTKGLLTEVEHGILDLEFGDV
jgi:hypothetical protein